MTGQACLAGNACLVMLAMNDIQAVHAMRPPGRSLSSATAEITVNELLPCRSRSSLRLLQCPAAAIHSSGMTCDLRVTQLT